MKTQRANQLFILACVLAVLLAVVLPSLYGLYNMKHRYDHIDIAEAAEFTHIEFPPGSKVLASTGIPFMHKVLWAKIEMNPKDVEGFLAALNKKHPIYISHKEKLKSGITPSPEKLKSGTYPWWTPNSPKRFVSAKSAISPGSGGTEIALVISLDNPEKAVLYLSYFND